MRKISQLAAQAFLHGKSFHMSNTVVQNETGTIFMYLHGNRIAMRELAVDDISTVRIALAGWATPTTRERLNGLLDTLGADVKLYQSKHCQYLGDEDMPTSVYVSVKTRC